MNAKKKMLWTIIWFSFHAINKHRACDTGESGSKGSVLLELFFIKKNTRFRKRLFILIPDTGVPKVVLLSILLVQQIGTASGLQPRTQTHTPMGYGWISFDFFSNPFETHFHLTLESSFRTEKSTKELFAFKHIQNVLNKRYKLMEIYYIKTVVRWSENRIWTVIHTLHNLMFNKEIDHIDATQDTELSVVFSLVAFGFV